MVRKAKLSDEGIIKMYQSGMTYNEMLPLVGIGERGIRKLLNRSGIETTRTGSARIHHVNENFFKTWSHEMAWVLGMFITDGNISKDNPTITFAQKDQKILKLIAKYMDADYVLGKIYNTRTTPVLLIHSREIIKDLNKLGITKQKSLVVPFPNVPENYLHSFVRGIIDGDGWVQDRGFVMNVTTASFDFANGLLSVFQSWNLRSEITNQTTQTGRIIYRVWVKGKEDLPHLAEIIYKDCIDNYVEHKREKMSQRLYGQSSLF